MPINLEPIDVSAELADVQSVLFVNCPVCPQIILAMQWDAPWLELLVNGLKTGALEDHIEQLRDPLDERGIRTAVFTMRAPLPMMCLWTEWQRKRLRARAQDFDALVVLGCDSAAFTAEQVLRGTDCRVLPGMKMLGIANATVSYRFPFTFTLQDATRVMMSQGDKGTTHG